MAELLGRLASGAEVADVQEDVKALVGIYEELLDAAGSTSKTARSLVKAGLNFTYLAFRLVLFPALLIWLARDVRAMDPFVYDELTAFELYVFPASIFFVLALSVKWAYDVLTRPPEASVAARTRSKSKKH